MVAAVGTVMIAVVSLAVGWWEESWCADADQMVCMVVASRLTANSL